MTTNLASSIRPPAFALGSVAWLVLALSASAQSAGPLQFVPQAQLSEPTMLQFGRSLSLSGDDLLVRAGPDGGTPHGQFVYHRRGSAWSQQAAFDDFTGNTCFDNCMSRQSDVAIGGNTAVTGQPGCHGTSEVRIRSRSGTTWGPPDVISGLDVKHIGASTLVHNSVVFVGGPETGFPGLVALFRLTGSGWTHQGWIGATDPGADQKFGALLAGSGTTLLVGARDMAEVLVQGATTLEWDYQASLVPPGGARLQAAAIDGDVAVLSTSATCSANPGVHVYERSGTTWTLTATLTAADAAPPVLGKSLLLRGETIYAGAPSVDSSMGAVYVFQRQGTGWLQTAKLTTDPALPAGAKFGSALAGDGQILCVGAPGTGTDPGTVEIFDVVDLPNPDGYCVAKVNSQGCLPHLSSTGFPGETNPSPFLLGATNVLNNKTGILLYSKVGSAMTPFQGGFLCIAQPFRRTPAQNSGGNPPPNDCSGAYSFDFNARIQSGIDPGLLPGVQVWVQYYSRDPGDPFQVGLTDGRTFTIGS